MFKIVKSIIVALVAIAVLISPIQSMANEQIVVEGLYRHPLTGNIEDSGGESSEALGQSMVTKMVGEFGSYDPDRKTLDIVFGLMNSISNVDIQVQFTGTNEFTPVDFYEASRVGEDATFTVPLSAKSDILRAEAFIEPMGRAVVFYVVIQGALDTVESNVSDSTNVSTSGGTQNPTGLIIGGPDVDKTTNDNTGVDIEIEDEYSNTNYMNNSNASEQTWAIFMLACSILIVSGVVLILFAMMLPKVLEDRKVLKLLEKERELQKFEREVTTKEEEEFNTEEIIRLLEEDGLDEQNKDA